MNWIPCTIMLGTSNKTNRENKRTYLAYLTKESDKLPVCVKSRFVIWERTIIGGSLGSWMISSKGTQWFRGFEARGFILYLFVLPEVFDLHLQQRRVKTLSRYSSTQSSST